VICKLQSHFSLSLAASCARGGWRGVGRGIKIRKVWLPKMRFNLIIVVVLFLVLFACERTPQSLLPREKRDAGCNYETRLSRLVYIPHVCSLAASCSRTHTRASYETFNSTVCADGSAAKLWYLIPMHRLTWERVSAEIDVRPHVNCDPLIWFAVRSTTDWLRNLLRH
jgi:hypothetical protein